MLVYGWIVNYGDVACGRLDKFPEPAGGITWIHAIPPIFILLLTRYDVPISTTFLILTVFAPTNLRMMLTKSLVGYGLAIGVGFLVYVFVSRVFESRFIATQRQSPKDGGAIQGIVTSKTNTTDIRSAPIIDFMFACMLFYFKQVNNIPMSTTWVFPGLLAGRELGLTFLLSHRPLRETTTIILQDAGKAAAGLLVSLGLAFGLPALSRAIDSGTPRVASLQERPIVEPDRRPPVPEASSEVNTSALPQGPDKTWTSRCDIRAVCTANCRGAWLSLQGNSINSATTDISGIRRRRSCVDRACPECA